MTPSHRMMESLEDSQTILCSSISRRYLILLSQPEGLRKEKALADTVELKAKSLKVSGKRSVMWKRKGP
jgi:hypothetical protein